MNVGLEALIIQYEGVLIEEQKVKDKKERIKAQMQEYMREDDLESYSGAGFTASFRDEYTRVWVDTNRLKKEQPAIFKDYAKKTKVKGSFVVTKIKEKS